MGHVNPARWADAAHGRLDVAQVAAMEQHAGACARCRAERARVTRALGAFEDIRNTPPPPLGWDHIGARIHWVVSSERRGRAPATSGSLARRVILLTAAAAAVVTAATFAVVRGGAEHAGEGKAPAAAHVERAAAIAPAGAVTPPDMAGDSRVPDAAPLEAVVTFLQGEVTEADEPLAFDRIVAAGQRIATGAGKIAVQFDRDSGFALGEGSALTLRSFDRRHVILAVEGAVFVDLARRAPDQSFVVVAGEHEIHVRGTSFHVEHRNGRLRVACGHGEVSVRGHAAEVAIGAGEVVEWQAGELRRGRLDLAEITDMQRQVFRVPAWAGARALHETSATLQFTAAGSSPVEIDGVIVGAGAFAIRVMSGRHHIRAQGVPGTWVEAEPGATLRAPVPASASVSTTGRKRRQAELERALDDGARLEGCVRALRKQEVLEGAFIVLDLGVLGDGTIAHLNIDDTNLPRTTARCVRDVVDTIAFAPGPAVTLRQRIAW